MSALVLPGDIPGLLRRGSPVSRLSYGARVRQEDSTIIRCGDGRYDIGAPGELTWIPGTHLLLDLTDATGRVHAAWWLASCAGRLPDFEYWLRLDVTEAEAWHCAGVDYDADSAMLAHLDFYDTRLLPDGSRWVDAEALRLVCLHVAGRAP